MGSKGRTKAQRLAIGAKAKATRLANAARRKKMYAEWDAASKAKKALPHEFALVPRCALCGHPEDHLVHRKPLKPLFTARERAKAKALVAAREKRARQFAAMARVPRRL